MFRKARQARLEVQPSIKTIHLTSRLLRIGTWLITHLLYKFKFTPDLVSVISIFFGITSAFFASQGKFFYFVALYFGWAVFDCCDGELFRLYRARGRALPTQGAVLEPINSDIQYSIMLPAIAIGLSTEGLFGTNPLLFCLVSVAGYTATRKLLGTNQKHINHKSSHIINVFYSQTKSGSELRKQNSKYELIYILWRNTLTQFGIFPFVVLIAIWELWVFNLVHVVVFYSICYSLFTTLIICGAVYMRTKLTPT